RHPAVADVAVVAMPDEMLIERACAYLVARPGMKAPDVRSLATFLEKLGLAKFKFPERIELLESFPVTRVGKLDKARLRTTIAEKLAREKNAAACATPAGDPAAGVPVLLRRRIRPAAS